VTFSPGMSKVYMTSYTARYITTKETLEDGHIST
jgi:hypothetical protein